MRISRLPSFAALFLFASLLIFLASLLAGCSEKREAALVRNEERPYQLAGESRDIAGAKSLRPQLPKPFRLALYLAPPEEKTWSWGSAEKEEIRDLAEFLTNRRLVSQYFFLNELTLTGSSNGELRVSAARAGADALLVLKGRAETKSSLNPFAALYVTIIGYFLFPGTTIDAEMKMQSALIDVGNGYVYLSNDALGDGATFGPGGVVREEDAVTRAKRRALPELIQDFLNSLAQLG